MLASERPAATISTGTGSGGTSATSCNGTESMSAKAGISGRSGFQRNAIAEPTTPPIAPAVRISPQREAPPSSSRTTSGPSTKYVAIERFETANAMKAVQSQVRRRTSPTPRATSLRKVVRVRSVVRHGNRIATRKTALTRNVTASIAKMMP